MKNTIMKLINKGINRPKFVYDIDGNSVAVADMKDDTFYCLFQNTLISEKNIATWKEYIADNTDAPVKKEAAVEIPKKVVKKKATKKAKKAEK